MANIDNNIDTSKRTLISLMAFAPIAAFPIDAMAGVSEWDKTIEQAMQLKADMQTAYKEWNAISADKDSFWHKQNKNHPAYIKYKTIYDRRAVLDDKLENMRAPNSNAILSRIEYNKDWVADETLLEQIIDDLKAVGVN
jgi:hypothetical protein